MTNNDQINIKKNGKLFAIDYESGWQYWVLDGIIWSIHSDGDASRMTTWGGLKTLRAHLVHLWQVTGVRWEKREGMQILHPEWLPNY